MRIAVLASVLALLAQPCSAKQNLYLITLMGQSNMVGAGEVSELPAGFPAHPSKLWNFTNAYRWEPAREPVTQREVSETLCHWIRARALGRHWRSPTLSFPVIRAFPSA